MPPIEVEHYLSFDGNGEEKYHILKISPEVLEKLKA